MPSPRRIFLKHSSFLNAQRGVLVGRAKVHPAPGVFWRGKLACHVVMDCGWEGWLSGSARRIGREDAYERLRADPVGVLEASAAEGALGLARAIGRACAIMHTYQSSPCTLEGGEELMILYESRRLHGALAGADREAVVPRIPGWLRQLRADPELARHRETTDPLDGYLIPLTAWERSVMPCRWSGEMSRAALFGALLLLLLEDGGMALGAGLRADIIALGEELSAERSHYSTSLFSGAERFSRYRDQQRLRLQAPWIVPPPRVAESADLGLPPGLPAWG